MLKYHPSHSACGHYAEIAARHHAAPFLACRRYWTTCPAIVPACLTFGSASVCHPALSHRTWCSEVLQQKAVVAGCGSWGAATVGGPVRWSLSISSRFSFPAQRRLRAQIGRTTRCSRKSLSTAVGKLTLLILVCGSLCFRLKYVHAGSRSWEVWHSRAHRAWRHVGQRFQPLSC
jgi:hypothetical protein